MSGLAALVLIASSGLGQAQEASPTQTLREFAKDFLGVSTAEIVADTELPGAIKVGDKTRATLTFTWGVPDAILLVDYSADIEGKTVFRAKGVAGIDPKDKTLKLKWFASPGGCGEIAYIRQGKTWLTKGSAVDAAGVEELGTGTLERLDASTYVGKSIERTRDGKSMPAHNPITWTHKRP